jgi:hypothetical protein
LQACRVARQSALSVVEYTKLMMDMIDETLESQFRVLREIERENLKASRAYNKRVKENRFKFEN